ncbi:MAG: hypothetical protein JWQ35_478 [Bacteriovoracaceae bacterium]|nr:hypothetical protein [Bacteriovoracaceae bacterium]
MRSFLPLLFVCALILSVDFSFAEDATIDQLPISERLVSLQDSVHNFVGRKHSERLEVIRDLAKVEVEISKIPEDSPEVRKLRMDYLSILQELFSTPEGQTIRTGEKTFDQLLKSDAFIDTFSKSPEEVSTLKLIAVEGFKDFDFVNISILVGLKKRGLFAEDLHAIIVRELYRVENITQPNLKYRMFELTKSAAEKVNDGLYQKISAKDQALKIVRERPINVQSIASLFAALDLSNKSQKELFLKGLKNSSPEIRSAAVGELYRLNQESIPIYLHLLKDDGTYSFSSPLEISESFGKVSSLSKEILLMMAKNNEIRDSFFRSVLITGKISTALLREVATELQNSGDSWLSEYLNKATPK